MPQAAAKIASFFGIKAKSLGWKDTGRADGIGDVQITSEVLFAKLEDDQVTALREKYLGSQQERSQAKPSFSSAMDLRVAKIEKIERHPKADKLYIEHLEVGEGVTGVREERTIVSGLVPFYTEDQLLGKKIIVAYNLKPAKLRGIESKGMLLAAGDKNGISADGQAIERVEALDAGDCPTGTRLLPEGEEAGTPPAEIDIDTFFSYPIIVKDNEVLSGGKKLCLNGNIIRTKIIPNGEVH
jgi:methionyl-tRNA synthetase